MPSERRAEVIADNESAHRRVNEAIERGRWPGEDGPQAFRCECGRRGCTAMLTLTAVQYESVRENPRRFVVLIGHEDPSVEDVVDVRDDHLVVEKRDRAGQVAKARDPRS